MAEIDRDLEQAEQDSESEAVPFFARYLEDQKRVRTGVKAGGVATTLKYPSDGEDPGGGGGGGSGGGGSDPITLKFPSDAEDC
ncbi:microviridin/marinostatin family tricyclic proteinase inhibitor [Sorangium sp. So ce1036]|uniref:microviridin/marinostatin family tricyclic proteinase inhibitor n=1 Tax=Sorangium sp. So ce1036 TaxID=3133328 RepID=UPI003F0E9256